MASRCDQNRHVTTYDDLLSLFITLPTPEATAAATGGGVKQSLVYMVIRRVRRLLRRPTAIPFPSLTSAAKGHWLAEIPEDVTFPDQPNRDASGFAIEGVLARSLFTLSTGAQPSEEVRAVADTLIPPRTSARDRAVLEEAVRLITLSAGEPAVQPRPKPHRAATNQARTTRQHHTGTPLGAAAQQAVSSTTPSQQPPAAPQAAPQSLDQVEVDSEGGSLYYPPELDEVASDSGHSFGDTDSLGSVGQLVYDDAGDWTTLECDGPVDPSLDPLVEWCDTAHSLHATVLN